MTAPKSLSQKEIQLRIREARAAGHNVVGIGPKCEIIVRPPLPATVIDNPRWLTEQAAVERLGLSIREFRILVRDGILPPHNHPSERKWDRKALTERQSKAMIGAATTADTYVYFMEMGDYIKIGFSASPSVRRRALETGPYDIKLLFAIRASVYDERDLHALFKLHHHRGEWFRAADSLRVYIGWLQKITPRNRVWRGR